MTATTATLNRFSNHTVQVCGYGVPSKALWTFAGVLMLLVPASMPLLMADALGSTRNVAIDSNADASDVERVHLERNRGQWGPSIRYAVRTENYAIAFGARSMLLHRSSGDASSTATLHFRGANPAPTLSMLGATPHPGTAPTEIAPNRPHDTTTNVDAVSYRNVYPGIDVVFRLSQQRNLSYDFVVAHDADPSQIAFEYRGAQAARIGSDGEITLALGDEVIKQGVPAVYRSVGDTLVRVRGHFYQRADHTIAFSTQQ